MSEVDLYINEHPEIIKERLVEIRNMILELAPDATESISYNMPGYKLRGKPLIYFAAFKKHIGLYPLPGAIEAFRDRLEGFKLSVGAIQFPYNKPLPSEIIKEIIEYRIEELLYSYN